MLELQYPLERASHPRVRVRGVLVFMKQRLVMFSTHSLRNAAQPLLEKSGWRTTVRTIVLHGRLRASSIWHVSPLQMAFGEVLQIFDQTPMSTDLR